MTAIFPKNPNLSMELVRRLPDRTAKAIAWGTMVAVCAAAHFQFMCLISPWAATIGF